MSAAPCPRPSASPAGRAHYHVPLSSDAITLAQVLSSEVQPASIPTSTAP